MVTKFDLLFALFELKEASLSQIARKTAASPSATRQGLVRLIGENLVSQKGTLYFPNKENEKTWSAFDIMKFCRDKGINYNIFLTRGFAEVLRVGLEKGECALLDFKGVSYQTVRKYLTFLSRINLLLVVSKKPLKVKFLSDNVFEDVLDFFNLKLSSSRGGQLEESGVGYDEIETLLKRLLKDKKNINFAEIAEEQKIEFTSASTQLEGNTFTLEESRGLILQDIVPPEKQLKEANEVKNYFNAVNYLIANLKEEMSVSFILELHKITTFNLNVAQGIRTSRVSIAGNLFYKVAKASEILGNLNELCKKINDFLGKASTVKETIIFATFVHNEFQHIHPFEDGNSRTTRLLWNFVLMRKGFPLINLYSNARQEYLSLTKLAKERNDSRLNIFLLKIIKDNLFKLLRS